MQVIANLLKYTYAKNYENRERFDKDIAKTKQCSFFASHGSSDHSFIDMVHTVFIGTVTDCDPVWVS